MAKLLSGTRVYGNLTVDANLTITGSILPSANVTYDLGSPTLKWRSAYFSGNTIYIGDQAMSVATDGTWTFTSAGANIQMGATAPFNPPSANISGNLILGGSINSAGNILSTGLSVFGNTRIGSLATPGALHTIIGNVDVSGAGTEYFNIGGNIMAIIGSFDSITVRAAVTAIANGGTNGVGNIGATGATFNTVFAKATQAQYADLAEVYTSDQQYSAGTVVVFGGEAEVMQSNSSHDTRIAGVVSTEPAYLMNSTETGVPVALQGRVPCRVLGPVSQGDRVVSSHIAGVAQALDPLHYQPGCIIGKALQAIESTDISIIEVVVGRV